MSRMSLFNSPLLLGFDEFERTLDRIGKSADNYPPYNIEQLAENHLRITLAVAGFTRDSIEVRLEANQLTVRGKQPDQGERMYLHRGIAARQFQRSFMLADGLEVTGANLANGLLEIDVIRPVTKPEVRRIPIANGDQRDGRVDIAGRAAAKEDA
ncbi:MAG TPA: Hsp20 family protein [Dongiaceae bacterium]|nr:Hsp20 family protein [Dongiaceae bacterium]